MKEFPLWTSVTLPYEAEHATSAYVEGYFNDLKTRVFKHYTKTIRADIYLKAHALDIISGTLLFTSKLISFEKRCGSVPIFQLKNDAGTHNSSFFLEPSLIVYGTAANDSDLLSQENWRAKATVQNMEDDDESIEDNIVLIGREIQMDELPISKSLNAIKIDSVPVLLENSNSIQDFNSLQSLTDSAFGLIPTSLEMLETINFNTILSDHSYSKTDESDSTQNLIKSTMTTRSEMSEKNVNEKYRLKPNQMLTART